MVAWLLHAPDTAQGALLLTFCTALPAIGSFVARILSNSPAGSVPIQRALNGGATKFFAEEPHRLPEEIKTAIIEKGVQHGDD